MSDARGGYYKQPFRPGPVPQEPNPDLAVCKVENIPTSVFFVKNERDDPALVQIAKAYCNRCPEREACLVYAMGMRLDHGIYGGRTASERIWMRRLKNKLISRQEAWQWEYRTKNWNKIAIDMGLPPDWRSKLDPPEFMIDSDSKYLRVRDGKLGCHRQRCPVRFETLEECFRHAHDPNASHEPKPKEAE
jgi:Transcription factor WhiB